MNTTFAQLQEYGYRTCIPYYIFWDKELTLNHHRLYCLIEQTESNPNPKVKPTFSYKWFADLIGIDVRSAKRIAQTLKRKKYIEHVRLSDNTWIWRTVKNIGLQDGEDVKIKTELDIFEKKKGAVKAPNNPI